MFEENNDAVDNSAETTTQDDYESSDSDNESTDESQAETGEQSSESRKTETPDQRRARIKRMYEREFGKQGDKGASEGSKEASKESSTEGDDRYARLELKTEGVTSKKAQDVVLEYAKFKGIDAVEALKSPIVKAEIAELEKKTSVPAPSKRTTTGSSDDFSYWVAQAKKGNFPRHDRAMMEKLAKARIW
jgi:hypothetical protein